MLSPSVLLIRNTFYNQKMNKFWANPFKALIRKFVLPRIEHEDRKKETVVTRVRDISNEYGEGGTLGVY